MFVPLKASNLSPSDFPLSHTPSCVMYSIELMYCAPPAYAQGIDELIQMLYDHWMMVIQSKETETETETETERQR